MIKPNNISESLFESENLYDKVMLLGEAKAAELVSGIQWAYDNKLNGILVGGTAVVHYLRGGRDLTPDADYMVPSISDIKAKLDELNERWDDIIGVDGDVIGITALDRNTDFLDPNKAGGNRSLNRAILTDPVIATVAGRQVKMICPELLAIMKLELGREKDTNDGFALLMSGKVNKNKYTNYVEALGSTLQDKVGLLSYAELIP